MDYYALDQADMKFQFGPRACNKLFVLQRLQQNKF